MHQDAHGHRRPAVPPPRAGEVPSPDRRQVLRLLGAGAAAVPFAGVLAACAPPRRDGLPDDAPQIDAGGDLGHLTIALPGSLSTLDVAHEAGVLNYAAVLLAQESLLTVAPDGTLGPGLAVSWSRPDDRTYVYDLRPGVVFHDGSPMTADDVVHSIRRHLDPASASQLAYAYAAVDTVEATGPLQVTVRLKEPYAMFGWTPTPGTLLVTPRAFAERHGDRVGTPGALISGTGPFKVTSFAPDDHVELVRNDAWWGGHVRVGRIRLDFISDDGTRLMAMRSGALDGAINIPADQAPQWQRIEQARVHHAPDRSVVALAFNTAKAPWNDLDVRRAVASACDRKGYVDGLLRGRGEVATALVTRDQWSGLLGPAEVKQAYDAIPGHPYDMDRARELLASSSAAGGFSEDLHYPSSGSQIGRAALALKEALAPLGIRLNVKEVPLEQWIAELAEDRGLQVLWYFPTTGDPAELLEPYLHSESIGATNIARYRNPAVDAALTAQKSTPDPARRAAELVTALQTAGADLPYHPLWWGQAATALRTGVGVRDFGPFFYVGPWATRLFPTTS